MPAPTLWDRLKGARIFQVLLVYLGASWVVLQIAELLAEALALPEWVLPVAVLLLLIGLVIIMATAWVQSLPSTTAREVAGEVPTDWEVAPGDVLASLRAGELPHLTWGRTILGGVVALSLLFGVAGIWVGLGGARGLLGPTEASASRADATVVILPFQTRGGELEVYGEGLVDLLTTNLEGLGGIRTVNAGTVVARWRAELGESLDAELDDALRVAGGLGARWAVRGSAVAAGPQVRIVADVYDLGDGARVGSVRAEGAPDAMLGLVDGLTVDLAQLFVGRAAGSLDLALQTRSLEALEAYLRGEAHYRQSRFREAVNALQEAVAADSTFALAYRRLGMAWGWLEVTSPEGGEASAKALALAHRLPERERLLTRAEAGTWTEAAHIAPELRAHVRLHPEDGEAWEQIGEYAMHVPWMAGSPEEEVPEAMGRAVALQPSFTPRYSHLLDLALAEGDADEFERLLAALEAEGGDPGVVADRRDGWTYLHGTEEERREIEAGLLGAPLGSLLPSIGPFLYADTVGPSAPELARLLGGRTLDGFPMVGLMGAGVGLDPEAWPAEDRRHGLPILNWGLLAGDAAVPPAELLADAKPTPFQALAVAVLAAQVGDDALVARAEDALRAAEFPTDPTFIGPLTREEALRYPRGVALLRAGDAEGALALMEETLRQPGFQPLAVLLAGDAHAMAGRSEEAFRHWETLLRTFYRTHVRLRRGRVFEAQGDAARAGAEYGSVLVRLRGGDPPHPAVLEAREALARLGG